MDKVDVFSAGMPQASSSKGLIGQRIKNTVNNRLKQIIDHPLMLNGFKKKSLAYPWTVNSVDGSWEGGVSYSWQGEYVGKWLHAATILAISEKDKELAERVKSVADELVSYQEEDGYLGVYDKDSRITAPYGPHSEKSWDVWTHRYNIYGLLTAYSYFGNQKWLDACKRMGDLLIGIFGPNGRNITFEGTRNGISALTIIESIMMLYRYSGENKYLEFAKHIVYKSSEERTKVLSILLKKQSVQLVGGGKAYQLMAVLLGVLDLYRYTGDKDLLTAVLNAWEDIQDGHVHITGGPWSRKTNEDSNRECFAETRYWSPSENVENCATVTWIQLNCSLLCLTGEAKFADAAELTMYNHLSGSFLPECNEGTYFSYINEDKRAFTSKLHCCNSSWPRALAVINTHICLTAENSIAVNFYESGLFQVQLKDGGCLGLALETDYPLKGNVKITVQMNHPLNNTIMLRIPSWSKNTAVKINGGMLKESAVQGEWLQLIRVWNNHDVIELEFDMAVNEVNQLVGEDLLAAYKYGPLVLSAFEFWPKEEKELPMVSDRGISSHKYAFSGEGLMLEGPYFKLQLTEPVHKRDNSVSKDVTLLPYYQASAKKESVITWFRKEKQQ